MNSPSIWSPLNSCESAASSTEGLVSCAGARIAQSAEHQTFNLRVQGSSPCSGVAFRPSWMQLFEMFFKFDSLIHFDQFLTRVWQMQKSPLAKFIHLNSCLMAEPSKKRHWSSFPAVELDDGQVVASQSKNEFVAKLRNATDAKVPLRFELRISCLLDRRFNQLSHGARDTWQAALQFELKNKCKLPWILQSERKAKLLENHSRSDSIWAQRTETTFREISSPSGCWMCGIHYHTIYLKPNFVLFQEEITFLPWG